MRNAQDFIDLRNKGYKHKEISKELNCSMSLVEYYLKQRAIQKEKRRKGVFVYKELDPSYERPTQIKNRQYIKDYLKKIILV